MTYDKKMTEFLKTFTDPYFLMGLAGFLLSLFVVILLTRKNGIDSAVWFPALVWGGVGLFAGAHLLFFIVGLPDFIENFDTYVYSVQSFLDAFLAAASGMVFYGGLFGFIAASVIFCKVTHAYTRSILNVFAVIFPLFHAVARVGCVLSGCCYGIEYHGIFAIQYKESQIIPGMSDALCDYTRFPVQLLEGLMELIIFVIILMLYLKTKNRFCLAGIYIMAYAVVRFCDEFLRGDTVRGIWGPFSTSQWIALVSFVCVGLYFIITRIKENHRC